MSVTLLVTLADLKSHLNIAADFTDDDTLLTEKLTVSQLHIQDMVGSDNLATDYPDGVPDPLLEAIRQYAGALYACREGLNGGENPQFGTLLDDLVASYRAWVC